MESIIPTPSIDQVLQSLASNALSSTSAQDSEEDQPGGREGLLRIFFVLVKNFFGVSIGWVSSMRRRLGV